MKCKGPQFFRNCFEWTDGRSKADLAFRNDLHKVVCEELLQLPLCGRIGEVSNVQSTTLCSTLDNCFVCGRVDRLVTSSANVGNVGGTVGRIEGGVGHLSGGTVNLSFRHDECLRNLELVDEL